MAANVANHMSITEKVHVTANAHKSVGFLYILSAL